MKSIVGILLTYTDADGTHDTSVRGRDFEEAKRKADYLTKKASSVTYKCVYGADLEEDE